MQSMRAKELLHQIAGQAPLTALPFELVELENQALVNDMYGAAVTTTQTRYCITEQGKTVLRLLDAAQERLGGVHLEDFLYQCRQRLAAIAERQWRRGQLLGLLRQSDVNVELRQVQLFATVASLLPQSVSFVWHRTAIAFNFVRTARLYNDTAQLTALTAFSTVPRSLAFTKNFEHLVGPERYRPNGDTARLAALLAHYAEGQPRDCYRRFQEMLTELLDQRSDQQTAPMFVAGLLGMSPGMPREVVQAFCLQERAIRAVGCDDDIHSAVAAAALYSLPGAPEEKAARFATAVAALKQAARSSSGPRQFCIDACIIAALPGTPRENVEYFLLAGRTTEHIVQESTPIELALALAGGSYRSLAKEPNRPAEAYEAAAHPDSELFNLMLFMAMSVDFGPENSTATLPTQLRM